MKRRHCWLHCSKKCGAIINFCKLRISTKSKFFFNTTEISFCPKQFSYAYSNGENCCNIGLEDNVTIATHGKACDGQPVNLNSVCCGGRGIRWSGKESVKGIRCPSGSNCRNAFALGYYEYETDQERPTLGHGSRDEGITEKALFEQ